MRRGARARWVMASALILGTTVACDDGPADPDGRAFVTVTGEVRLDGAPAAAGVSLEDLSVGSGIARNLTSTSTGTDGRYTLQAEVDAETCASLYVSVLVVVVREGASLQIGASEPTRGCGERTLDFELSTPS